ncbi:MAG: hypothetical protein OXH57_00370 [Ekhidna sp.]|nr:hypothetical protein [Ekhidna sp.]
MRRLTPFIFLSAHVFCGCTDTNTFSITTQYILENHLKSEVLVSLYNDSTLSKVSKSLELSTGDSILFYECSVVRGDGFCHPFDGSNEDEVASDYASITFFDGKELRIIRYLDTNYNLLLGHRYGETNKISNDLGIIYFVIDTTDYLLAK